MIKFYISYFYKIRFMKPNMLPLSTATFDPGWYHQNGFKCVQWINNNGVLIGCRWDELSLDHNIYYNELITKELDCESFNKQYDCKEKFKKYQSCPFMNVYKKYLLQHGLKDFNEFVARIQGYVNFINKKYNLNVDTVVLIVHEPSSVLCGERPVLRQIFEENGYKLPEWDENKN